MGVLVTSARQKTPLFEDRLPQFLAHTLLRFLCSIAGTKRFSVFFGRKGVCLQFLNVRNLPDRENQGFKNGNLWFVKLPTSMWCHDQNIFFFSSHAFAPVASK